MSVCPPAGSGGSTTKCWPRRGVRSPVQSAGAYLDLSLQGLVQGRLTENSCFLVVADRLFVAGFNSCDARADRTQGLNLKAIGSPTKLTRLPRIAVPVQGAALCLTACANFPRSAPFPKLQTQSQSIAEPSFPATAADTICTDTSLARGFVFFFLNHVPFPDPAIDPSATEHRSSSSACAASSPRCHRTWPTTTPFAILSP